jgi:hypothetical protein
MNDQTTTPPADDPATPFVSVPENHEQVTPDPVQADARDEAAAPSDPVQPVPNVDQAPDPDPDDLDEVAGTVVLPLYEQRLQEASARGDSADIADIMEEYNSKRLDRARKIISERNQQEG